VENLPAGRPAPAPPGRDDSGEPVSSPAAASLSARERVPWRPAVAGAASLATPVGIGMLDPLLGEVIAITEIAVALTVIAVALFGSQALRERAFRLLRWFGNRPEPPTPKTG
jgi:hypothetical protein